MLALILASADQLPTPTFTLLSLMVFFPHEQCQNCRSSLQDRAEERETAVSICLLASCLLRPTPVKCGYQATKLSSSRRHDVCTKDRRTRRHAVLCSALPFSQGPEY